MKALTNRQKEILNFIQEQMAVCGRPPTRAEIAKKMGFRSVNAAEDHLKALAKKQVIALDAGTSRGIRVLTQTDSTPVLMCDTASNDTVHIPLVGRVAAGQPILAQEHVQKHLSIPLSLFDEHPDFFLTVRGHSMKNIGMHDGDLLAVKRVSEARNGQVVVARINDEVTVKRFYKRHDTIELHPENPDFSILVVNPERDQFNIEGLAVGLIRSSPLH
jgi:repressor LexA